jgi:catechol 2,3-dioxygenase-like lactoylglutathione lyase family enzyme
MSSGRLPPVRHSGCHHAAICTRDWETSMTFWTEGIGLQRQFEATIDGPWRALFDASGDTLRSAFLHDPVIDDAGIVELVEFPSGIDDGTPVERPGVGLLLLSFYVDVDAVLDRLATLGLGGSPRRVEMPSPWGTVPLALVRDPNGVQVELIGTPGS